MELAILFNEQPTGNQSTRESVQRGELAVKFRRKQEVAKLGLFWRYRHQAAACSP
jgi:hypothetical protein